MFLSGGREDKNILLISNFDVGQAQNWNVISIFYNPFQYINKYTDHLH